MHTLLGRALGRWRGRAEGNVEFVGDLRPEFAENVESGTLQDVEAHMLCDRVRAVRCARMIETTEERACGGAGPFRNIGHLPAIVSMGNHRVAERMEEPVPWPSP